MKPIEKDDRFDRWMHWTAAVLSLPLMLWMLGKPPVQRTQEARVLEVAREMMGAPLVDWMIPHLNGEVRVQKPPLAYWLAAGAYEIGGVSEGVGRIPFAIAGWLTVIVTYFVARWLFGSRTATLAAGTLIASLMFARHGRLAETDILVTLFVTAAIVCIWRAWPNEGVRAPREIAWLALSGFMLGMAIFAKGLPALFVLVFLLGMSAATRQWRMLWRWCISGAPLIALVVGAPWYLYIFAKVGIGTFIEETRIGILGQEHKGTIINYIPDLLRAIAPWTALTIMALIIACFMWRRDWRMKGLVVWFAAVMVPLCVGGQRQYHYVLPVMPPLAVLSGWVLDEALTRRIAHWKTAIGLLVAMFIVMLLGSIAFPIIGAKVRPGMTRDDIFVAVIFAIASILGIWASLRAQERSGIVAVMLAGVAATIFTQSWLPSLQQDNSRAVAQQVQRLAPGPLCFYGENVSFTLVFNLQRTMPRYYTPEELSAALVKDPTLVVLAQTKINHPPPPLPANLEQIGTIEADEQTMNLYRRKN